MPPENPTNFPELEARYAAAVQRQLWRLRLRRWARWGLFASAPLGALILILIALMLFLPQSIRYDFANQKSCVVSPVIFPNSFKTDSAGTFKLSRKTSLTIYHTPVFSYRLCASPALSPRAQTAYTKHQWLFLGSWHLGKVVKVITANYPVAAAVNLSNKAIPIQKPLKFNLNLADATFDYAVSANGQTSPCTREKTMLSCSLVPLKLDYAASYHASLVRVFHGQSEGTVLAKTFQTITATAISQTSINSGATVYDKPQQITLTTDKTITSLQTLSMSIKNTDGTSTNVPITSSFEGQTITINIASPLPRKTTFDVHIANVMASDDSTLEQPYDLTFTTSGGPKVSGTNMPSYGMASGQAITVDFDQAPDPNQDPNQFASLLVNGVKQPATLTLSGQRLTIQPANGYPVCASVTVQLSAAAQNAYGVSGDSSWSYSSRSHCYTTFSIGTSVKGRPITAYQFGSGPSMVLYIAAMEGNEQNSANLLTQWIPNIDANPSKIPSYRTIVVIPQINPDGYAADTRLNADGIDLNRNFPANNWQTQVTEPLANNVLTNDGGPYPLSEPESQALANYFQANHPRLTLTEHSHGGIVEANDAGDSIGLGAQYAALAGYRAIPTFAIGNFFDYTTTGAFEDWANDKLGLPVLEVELSSPTSSEYSRNLPALWAMAQVSQ
jgi:protein MpaA